MTDIYILDCERHAAAILELESNISQPRFEAVQKQKKQSARTLTAGAEICLACALKLPLPIELKTQENGKPFLPGTQNFNISHSGKYVVCAVSDYPVGADIERISRMRPKIATRLLSAAENKSFMDTPEQLKAEYLCQIWTLKESYLKQTGEGLRADLRSLCTQIGINGAHFYTEKIEPGYLLSVCLPAADEFNLHQIDLAQINGLAKNNFANVKKDG